MVAPPGLEAVCAEEARRLGASNVRAVAGGVECEGGLPELLRLNLALRTGSRVLLRLGASPLAGLRRLADGVDWGSLLVSGCAFEVKSSGGGGRPAELERPIADAIRRKVPGTREGAGGETIHVRLDSGEVTVAVDSTGEHLHLRGYRQETGAAPLRENLAAGILALAGYDGSQPLLDPMCGSGTFLIEGAFVALGRAPGGERSFACERWPCVQPELVSEERNALRAAERAIPTAPILGSDRNAGALGVARRNAQRAGVLEHLKLSRADAVALQAPAPSGVLVCNPPYGKRVGEERELASLYRNFGAALRERFRGWTAAVLFADPALEPLLGLPSPQAHALRNGGIPCRLLVSRL